MLNKIIKYSLQNRLFVVIASVILVVAGVYTASEMDVDVFPDLNAPTVVVMTEAQGMAAEEVEKLVTFPIETSVNGATGVRRVRSSSTTGFSVVWVEFDWKTDIYKARQIVSEKLAETTESLPQGAGKPTLGPQSSILGEMLIVGLTSDRTSLQELRTIADWTIRPRLLSTGGVAQVSVIGGDIMEYQVLLNPSKMRLYGISLDQVSAALTDMTRNSTGGVVNQYGNEYIVRGISATTSPEEMGKAVVGECGGMPVVLEQVAVVEAGAKSPRLGAASERGKPAVLITVTKQPAANTIKLTEKIDGAMAELKSTLPADINISTDIFRQADFIENSINNIQKALVEGAVFVIVILFLFLMNGRTTVISLIALPLSLLVAILVLKLSGLTINTMSLGGMAIAIGSLVDDAIIDVENVFKRLRENHNKESGRRRDPLRVVFESSKEIRSSIVNATIITIVAFVPLFFLGGMEGRMLRPLGVAFIVALFASLIVALTLTPVLCSYLLTDEKTLARNSKEPWLSRSMKRVYEKSLGWALDHKKAVLAVTGVLFVAAVVVFSGLGRSFLPPFNEGSLTINVNTIPGSSLEESDKIGRTAEELLLTVPEIKTVARRTGRAELDEHALGVNVSEIEAPFALGDRSREAFTAEVREKLASIPGANIEIGQPISHRIDAMLSGTKANIAIKIFGPDLNRLFATGNQVRNAIAEVEGIADLNVEQQVERPQLHIRPRRDLMARSGVTMQEFNEFVDVALGGAVVSQVYDKGRSVDVTLKIDDVFRDDIATISDLPVDGLNGKVPLGHIADIVSSSGPDAVSRENAQRKIVVSANVEGRDLHGVISDIRERVASDVSLPEGYHIEYGGQFESEQAASRILMIASLLSLIVIFIFLFQEFRNLSLSAIVMINLPLALIGGVMAIWLTSGVISIPAIIGFISLFGIAARNGILLISRYNRLMEEGHSLKETVLTGSLDRLNPILMTALTSALALIPLAMGGHLPGNEIQSPMAKVILGGLISSTLLNGFVVPVVYMIYKREK